MLEIFLLVLYEILLLGDIIIEKFKTSKFTSYTSEFYSRFFIVWGENRNESTPCLLQRNKLTQIFFCVITKLVIIANIVFHCSTRACESRFLLYVNNKWTILPENLFWEGMFLLLFYFFKFKPRFWDHQVYYIAAISK